MQIPFLEELEKMVRNSRVWKSFFRHGYPDNPRDQKLVITTNVFLHLHPVRISVKALRLNYTWGLGGISVLLTLITAVTGILLMFFYVPSVERAYSDMQALQTSVTFGLVIRNLHRWAAHAMVLSVFLHMCRVFYTGAYRPPREFNWVVGVVLLLLTFTLSYTGYILPWDQLSYWAVTVGSHMASAAPLIGEQARLLILGAQEVGQEALIRFYTLHVIALPAIGMVFLAVHLWRIRKDGFSV